MTRRVLAALASVVVLGAPAAAQLPQADSAFNRGDYRAARVLYRSVLLQDSLNPRALYRLAIFDSWDGNLKQSLAGFATLRHVEPLDPDIMVAHAKVLSWAGRERSSEALYDSVLAVSPDRADALAGRARAVAWSGDLGRAERLWREALERRPDDAEILTGLAQTLHWEGQPGIAESYVARAREIAPGDPATRDVFDQVRAARRPTLTVSTDGADDSDHNGFVALSGTFSASLRSDVRGNLRASWRRNELGSATGLSRGVDGWFVKGLSGGVSLRGGVGIRSLDPNSGSTRSFATVQLGTGFRPARFASVNVGYGHYPFDETAALVDSGFVWDELQAQVEFSPRHNLDLSAVANAAWLSDSARNRRLLGALTAMVAVAKGLHVGGHARTLGYRRAGNGYFAPDHFRLAEGRVAYAWRRRGWGLRMTGGLGAQQVGSGAASQTEWHGDVTVSRSWRAIDELSLVALYTNSVTSRTATPATATYRYWSVGLRYRRGL